MPPFRPFIDFAFSVLLLASPHLTEPTFYLLLDNLQFFPRMKCEFLNLTLLFWEFFVYSLNVSCFLRLFALCHWILHRRDSIHLNADDGPLESQNGSMSYGESKHQNARWNGKIFMVILLMLLRNDSLEHEEDCFGLTTPWSRVMVNQFTITQEQRSEYAW